MNTTIRTARRFGATLAIAGIAAFGSVAIAPAASAASVDGPAKVEKSVDGKGPDAFIDLEHGRVPIFFCEADDSKDDKGKAKDEKAEKAEKADEKGKHHNNCQDVSTDGPRF